MSLIKRLFARSRAPKVGIAAIVKNEAPYLVEWIALHLLIGIDHFYIADNESSDGTSELLEELAAKTGLVTRLPPTPGIGEEGPQQPTYRDILARFGSQSDWLAFIDADEFIVPTANERSLPAHLSRIADDGVGCVVLNWAVYGSSGLTKRDERPVLERFSWRANAERRINHTVKSLVRSSVVEQIKNPHEFALKPGYRTVHIDGGDMVPWYRPGHSEGVSWTPFRLNHYVVKSFEEWLEKQKKGRVDHPTARRKETFFADKDYADECELPDAALLADTKRRMESLAAVAGVLRP